ncbi:MAG: DUF11 domain-containing protein [Gemmataceae bacterium]|nr:DUF11 domain-containing protein [Gemmataceae bacterium]
MLNPRTRFSITLLLILGVGNLYAQGPNQSREPPLADEVEVEQAKGRFDPDKASPIRQAQNLVPATVPNLLPGGLVEPFGVVQTSGTQVVVPAGDLATPVVTLDVEGSEVSPSGQAIIYKLTVKNVSRAKAHNVIVKVIPPKNAEPVKRDPPPTHEDAESRWELKILEPGQTRTIELSYKPKPDADEVKIQARVQYDFGRGLITKVAPPSLSVKKEGPDKLVIGDTVAYKITVTNNGKVTVRDIEVKEMLSAGMVYEDREMSRGTVDGKVMSNIDPKKGERMWTIPVLAPGQTNVIEYRVKAQVAGRIPTTVMVNAPDVKKETGLDIEVLTAMLHMKADGPINDKGKVGQAANYRIVVENNGNADLKNVCVRCVFPPDMRPTKATQGGQPFKDSVQWIFRELKVGEAREINVNLSTTTPGTRAVSFAAKADKGTEQRTAVKTSFAGVSALSWETDVPGTTGAGKNMIYKVTVANTGTAEAKATQLRIDLPENVDLVGTTPDAGRGSGQNAKMVIFSAYDIPAGKKTTFRIEVKARSAGEARVVFQLVGEGVGSEPAEHRKSTTITGFETRSPLGPPPARPDGKIDRTTIGALPKE